MGVFRRLWSGYYDRRPRQPSRSAAAPPAASAVVVSRVHPSRNVALRDGTFRPPDHTPYRRRRGFYTQPAAVSRLAYPSRIHPSRNPQLRDGTFDTPDVRRRRVSRVFPTTRASDVFYVDESAGDDTGDGSFGNPWKYLSTHTGSLVAGDMVYYRGTNDSGARQAYTDDDIQLSVNATSGNHITISTYNDEYIKFTKQVGGTPVFEVTGDYYDLDFRGTLSPTDTWPTTLAECYCEIDADRTDWTGAIRITNADNVTVKGVDLHNGEDDQAFRISESTNVLVEFCRNYDHYHISQGSNAFIIRGSNAITTTATIRYCEIYDCGADGIHIISSDASANTTVIIEDCDIYSNDGDDSENAVDIKQGLDCIIRRCKLHGFRDTTVGGGSGGNGTAIVVQQESTGTEIYDNEIYDFSGSALASTQSVEFYRNVVYDLIDEAGAWRQVFSFTQSDVVAEVYNNTIQGDFQGNGLLVHFVNAPTVTFKNNLFNDTGGITLASESVTADYNGWYGSSTRHWSGANDVVDQDPGGDPYFVDEANDDYRIQSRSGAVDQGTVQAPYTDGYKGSAPDIGYYETQLPVLAIPVIHPSRNPQLRDATFAAFDITIYLPARVFPPVPAAVAAPTRLAFPGRVHPSRNPQLRDGTFAIPDLTQYQPHRVFYSRPAAVSRLAYPSRAHPSRNMMLRDATFRPRPLTEYQPRRLYINRPAAVSRLAYPSRAHPSRNMMLRDATFRPPDLTPYRPRHDVPHSRVITFALLFAVMRKHPSRNITLRDTTFRPQSRVYYRVSHAATIHPQTPGTAGEVLFKGMWRGMRRKMR